MSDPVSEKPVCGGGLSSEDEYDLPLHVAAVFIVFAASILGAGFPVVAKKVKWMRIPPTVFFFCKHFGTGVLIATAFVHLLPTAFLSLSNPCLPDLLTDKYPAMPGVIMMGSLFCLFLVEMWLNSKTGGHSHGGATGHDIVPANNAAYQNYAQDSSYPQQWPIDEKKGPYQQQQYAPQYAQEEPLPSEMPAWFVVFYEQYVRQRDEMITMINRNMPAIPAFAPKAIETSTYEVSDGTEAQVDPLVLRKMNLDITLLEGGILFHSIFVGMTISITTEGFVVLLVAILFHQAFEGLGLGSRIAAVPYPRTSPRPWILVCAFGLTCPIGQAIGLATRGSYDPDSAFGLIIVGVFNAISSGLLIYASLVDLLAEDFLSEAANKEMNGKKKMVAFFYLFLGAMGMSIVGAFA